MAAGVLPVERLDPRASEGARPEAVARAEALRSPVQPAARRHLGSTPHLKKGTCCGGAVDTMGRESVEKKRGESAGANRWGYGNDEVA